MYVCMHAGTPRPALKPRQNLRGQRAHGGGARPPQHPRQSPRTLRANDYSTEMPPGAARARPR